GNVSFLSQSGSLGAAVMEKSSMFNLGLRHFISVGNRADVGTADVLSLWKEDSETESILLYLETIDQPRRLRFTALKTAQLKPVIALKGGQSSAGLRATSSHTGSLLKSSPILQQAYFKQSSIISVNDLPIFMGLSTLLTKQPLPNGNRVAIITNGGGPGILVTDACENNGLSVPELSQEIQEELREFLPSEASVGNPVDMIASATPEHYRKTVETVAKDPNIDAIIVIFIPPLTTKAEDVARKLKEAMENIHSSGHCKTLVAMFLSEDDPPAILFEEPFPIPTFTFPDEVAKALAKALEYKQAQENSYKSYYLVDDINFKRISETLADKEGWLSAKDTHEILQALKLPVARTEFTEDIDQLLSLAADMPAPYVLKAEAPGLIHKSDVGAIRLNIHNVSELKQAAVSMKNSLIEKGYENISFILQSQQSTKDAYEMMAGVSHTELGHSVVVGQGGTAVEVLKDIATGVVPITKEFANEMIKGLKIYNILKGYRTQRPYDISPLADILLRLASLVEVFPEIKDIDLNPIFLYPDRAKIVDFRMLVEL
ncbi:MAG: acetate--CoA ligase family protein, partial [Chlorobi bacterium]|nr:acetate--CoA ligase family protein [Chlorobiota bacterium]